MTTSQPDLFDADWVQWVQRKRGVCKTLPYAGVRACAHMESFAKPYHPPAPTAPKQTRAQIFDAWLAECRAYDAAGRQGEVPPLPERYLTNGPKLWRDGPAHAGKRWR
jgi:hypothetical protein